MTTKVYGASDDLIEFEGEVYGEVCDFGTDERDRGVLLLFSDDTILEVKYGKGGDAIWGIRVLRKGKLLDRVDGCVNENSVPYSDVAHFKNGLKWAKAASDWLPCSMSWEDVS